MADFDSQLPVRALATEFTTEVANAAGTTINPVEEFAQGSTTSGQSGPLDQGAVTTAAPTYATGTTAPLSLDTSGNLRTTATFIPSGTQNVNVTQVGGNPVTTTVPVSGTVTVVQPTGTNLHTVIDNFPADADALAQGSTTSGQLGALEMGATTTAAPTYSTGTTNPLSLTTAGALRVDGSAVTQPVSGTFFQATQPVSGTVTVTQATGTNLHAVIDNFPADADALAQGSTTAAQLGALVMGATTTAAPTYSTSTTNPLSLDTAGNLRVTVSNASVVTPETLTYNTVAAVAPLASSTQTYTPGTNVYLDGIDASASGQMKVEMQIGGVTKAVMFTSKGNLQMMWRLVNPVLVTSGTAITVIRTNMDNQAMDVYSDIQTHL